MATTFKEAEEKERFCLRKILPDVLSKDYEWINFYTPINSYAPYDCLVQGLIDGSTKKRYIIEIKLREPFFDPENKGYVLEISKLNGMKKCILDEETELLYINTTETGTYVWNITQLENKGLLKPSNGNFNKSKMGSDKSKVNKGCIYLRTDLAEFHLPFKFNETLFQKEIENERLKNKKIKEKMDLMEWFFKTN